MRDKVPHLWGLLSPQEAGPDSSAALCLGSPVPRHPLGPPVRLPLPLCLQELRAEQAPGFLSPPPLWARDWGTSARPGVWASLPGASGPSRRRSPHPVGQGQCWPSWRASCCFGSPGKAGPASQRARSHGKARPEAWPGGRLFERPCPPLSLSAAPSAGARAGQRPWSPGEQSCRRLPAPGVAPGGPRKARDTPGLCGTPGPLGFASPAFRADYSSMRMRLGFQPQISHQLPCGSGVVLLLSRLSVSYL